MAQKLEEAEKVLVNPQWPASWPYTEEDFKRMDESDDAIFYDQPRLVYHIDDVRAVTIMCEANVTIVSVALVRCCRLHSHSSNTQAAVTALTKYYATEFKDGDDVLDICSSWVSHYPPDWKGGKVVGLGMNEYELSQNPVLTAYNVKDLNADPTLPYEDASFDIVTCVVSVDYLNKPLQVFQEIGRVLRPGKS